MKLGSRFFPVWRIPILLTLLIWAGLLTALLLDGAFARALAWTLLSVPILVGFWCAAPVRRTDRG